MKTRILKLKEGLEPVRNILLSHPVYGNIKDLHGIQNFTQIHVFAVWDFMSLLKSLQIALTSVSIPWQPVGTPETRYLINEIVLGEESDVDENGNRISHFELYLNAMRQMGSDTSEITSFIDRLHSGEKIMDAIQNAAIPENVKRFLSFTFDIVLNAPVHVKASVFTFGREDLIPSMFHKLLDRLYIEMPEKISTFKYYIERHIEVDGDHHSNLAIDMVCNLCGEDEKKWEEAFVASQKALEMRYLLWDAVQG